MAQPENEQESPKTRVSEDSTRSSKTSAAPDVLDWDACLDNPPPRPSGTIEVRLRRGGRDKPIPVDEKLDTRVVES